MALGLNIVVGFAGLLDLGYVAFFAIGAYTIGWFGSGFFTGQDIHIGVAEQLQSIPGIHINYLLIIPIAAILAAALRRAARRADLAPARRLHRDRDARVRRDRRPRRGQRRRGRVRDRPFNLTNGRRGITPVDKIDLPFLERFTTLDLRPWYCTALVMALIVVFINIRLRDSRLGRAWIAVREDEVAAVSMGIPTVKIKLYAYAIGAALGGVAGSFLGSYFNTVNADHFEFSFSIFVLAMIILGGLGASGRDRRRVTLSFINMRLIPDVLNSVPGKIGLDFDLTQLGFGIFGFLLVIMMVLRPQGLIPEARRKAELTEGLTDDGMFEVKAP